MKKGSDDWLCEKVEIINPKASTSLGTFIFNTKIGKEFLAGVKSG